MKSFIVVLVVVLCSNSFFCQNLEWANSLKGQGISNINNLNEGASYCYGVDVDDNDFVYITGICNDSVDFDPGPGTSFVVAGQSDIYIAKYSPQGILIWRKVLISNSVYSNYIKTIKLDYEGNILIIGSIQNDVDFDPGLGVAMVEVQTGIANKMVIAKYDSNGYFIWVKDFGSSFVVWGDDLETDENGFIYITGSFYNTLDIDPSSTELILNSSGLALFFAKYDQNGNLVWAKHIPNSTNLGGASDIEVSEVGDVFIAGYFGGNLDFNPGVATYTLSSTTTSDRYFAKYTTDGDFVWANRIDVNDDIGLVNGRSVQIAIDNEGNVFLVGDFKGTVDFDAGLADFSISAPPGYSTYICKYSEDGVLVWAKSINGNYCVANDVEIDCSGSLNLSGVFSFADFDTGILSYSLISSAPSAFMNFFAQYDYDGNFNWVRRIGNNGYGGGILESGIHVKKGNQYVFGAFKQTGDFDPSNESEYLLSMGGIGWNSFFAKYSGNWKHENHKIVTCDDGNIALTPSVFSEDYNWQNGSTDSIFIVNNSGYYWFEQTEGECSKIDTFFVQIIECSETIFSMPNVFSPNLDGVNDLFLPISNYNISDYSITIVNRWGQVVFKSKNKNSGWDGFSDENHCSDGTYFWVVKFIDSSNKERRVNGFVNLVR